MAQVRLASRDGFVHEVETASGHTVTFDEPESAGGTNTAPAPTEMLAAALAACTAMTVKYYADHKGWDIEGIEVEADTTYDGPRPAAYRVTLRLPEHLDQDQQDRIRVVAGKCPVHHTLAGAIPVELA
ncbi:MAG: OsmC family protein [Actinomycetota bacterium]|nr:OsmC family protein [Actinomycetota bacterium]